MLASLFGNDHFNTELYKSVQLGFARIFFPLRWASLGDCFIALYDHLTSQDNPKVSLENV